MPETRVALMGLGTMGTGMAKNLLKAGFPLTVYNRTMQKTAPLAELGATVAKSPAEAVKGAEVVLSMLSDDEASRAVWCEEGNALAATPLGTVVVESGTVSPEWITELQEKATGRGLRIMDAPVTGSRPQAEAGELVFLVGADGDTLRIATPVLLAMSKSILHVGPLGSGAQLKLINNFLCGVQVASFAEALVWIERSGLDREVALQFLKKAAPGSGILNAMSDRMTKRTYEVNFLLRLMEKDLRYAHAAAAKLDVSLTTANSAEKLFKRAHQLGYAEQDMSAVVEVLRKSE